MPYVSLLVKMLDKAWRMLLGKDLCQWKDYDAIRGLGYCSVNGNENNCMFGVRVDGCGNLNKALEFVDLHDFHGQRNFGGACGYRVVLKEDMIELLQAQDVMHDFVFTHN